MPCDHQNDTFSAISRVERIGRTKNTLENTDIKKKSPLLYAPPFSPLINFINRL